MKNLLSKVIGSSIIASLLIVPMLSVRAEVGNIQKNSAATTSLKVQTEVTEKTRLEQFREADKQRLQQLRETEKQRAEQFREAEKQRLEQFGNTLASSTKKIEIRIENKEGRIENKFERIVYTENRLENRVNNIERIRARLASTTASTTEKRVENLNKNLSKQVERMGKVKERLVEKELKITDVLGKIASKIQERINILESKGLDLSLAEAKLAEASIKIESATTEIASITTLIETEITEASKDQLFTEIKNSQERIKVLAKDTHALLVDAIKEITKVLPAKPADKATTTASSTN